MFSPLFASLPLYSPAIKSDNPASYRDSKATWFLTTSTNWPGPRLVTLPVLKSNVMPSTKETDVRSMVSSPIFCSSMNSNRITSYNVCYTKLLRKCCPSFQVRTQVANILHLFVIGVAHQIILRTDFHCMPANIPNLFIKRIFCFK